MSVSSSKEKDITAKNPPATAKIKIATPYTRKNA